MLVNTQQFRQDAMYWKRHKKYDCGRRGTEEYARWWLERAKRCLYGYSVGGMWIPGYYYYYLNFCPIMQPKGNSSIGTNRVLDFPKFWDMDYKYFMSAHIARYGVPDPENPRPYLSSLPIDLNLQERADNLNGGKHLMWLKPRGVGASYKAGAMASRNFHLVKNSKTFFFADQKEYMTKDGIYNKFLEYMNYVNDKAPEFKSVLDTKSDRNNMYFRNSIRAEDGKSEIGMRSEVYGTPINNDADKARGKRGMLLLFEEAGRFGSLSDAWTIARESVEQDGIVFGLMIGFGTGGTEGNDFEGMETMFNTPQAYNILAYDNIYDEGMQGTDCGLFYPADYSVSHTDEYGNSNLKVGKDIIDKKYNEALLSADPRQLLKVKAEKPRCPQDAMLNTTINKFSSDGLVKWRNQLTTSKMYKQFGVPKRLEYSENGKVVAKLEENIPPIYNFPHSAKQDLRGTVVEYSTPFFIKDGDEEVIPDNLYLICHDPYADDDAEDVTSLGVAYVMMNYNNFVTGDTGNRIVASYIGRPRTTDEYNDVLFKLAKRWNARIAFENDRGDVVSYAKRKKLLNWLAPEFELGWDEKIKKGSTSTFRYGMRMGGGKDNLKILQGNKYIEDWLYEERGENMAGKVKMNYEFIYDIGLLDELRKFKPKQNFDRISALRIGMYYMRELLYQDRKPEKRRKNKRSFSRFVHTERFV